MNVYLAPMIDYTTYNYRKFIRLYNKEVILFTEMLVCDFIINNDNFLERIGDYDSNTIIQLGGNDPNKFIIAIDRIIKSSKFRRFNINCGCPSSKVQCGSFGAILMKTPEKIINIINHVYNKFGIIIDIKCRLGVDEYDSFEYFHNFIKQIIDNTPCKTFYVHARKCLLKGLSPLENRTIPPIKHEFVYEIKKIYPNLEIILNGEISCIIHLKNLDGIMIGRGAKNDIFIFRKISILKEIIETIKKETFNEKYKNIIEYNFKENQINILKYFLNLNFNDFKIPKDIEFRKTNIIKYLETFEYNELFNQRVSLPLFSALKGMEFNKVFKQFLMEKLLIKYTVSEFLFDINILFKQFYKNK